MNLADPYAEEPLDEAWGDALAAYDDALATDRPTSSDSAITNPDSQLARLQHLLHRLEKDRRNEHSRGNGDDPMSTQSATHPAFAEARREFGRFQILKELGQGGWGIVFLAWDPKLRRNVALKVPRLEGLLTSEHRRRFIREAQVAAGLDHPNIVPVYEGGEIGAVWYIASAYCQGITLGQWLKEQSEPICLHSAAKFVATLAKAIHYTHCQGVIHRDLKPGNILMPFADIQGEGGVGKIIFEQPKITDFGLAKVLAQEGDETRTGAVLGTPAYMAPEQVEGRIPDIGAATDVYALGVILYELLTGQVPFRRASDLETLREICDADPTPPSQLRAGLPRDLQAICLKCLEKDPERRYHVAGDLAKDLERFISGRPTVARPLPVWKRGAKWARRRPALLSLAAVVIVAILSLSGLGTWHVRQLHSKNEELQQALEEAGRQRAIAEHHERQARHEAYGALMGWAGDLHRQGETGLVAELLNHARPASRIEDTRGFAWYYLWRAAQKERTLRGHRDYVGGVAFSPDGQLCASGSSDRTIKLWDVATGKHKASLEGHTVRITNLAFSPNGELLASCGLDRDPGEVKLWNVASESLLADLTGSLAVICGVQFSPDGQTLAICGETVRGEKGAVHLCDLKTGSHRTLIEGSGLFRMPKFSADGNRLAMLCTHLTADHPYTEIKIWDFNTHKLTTLSSDPPQGIECLDFAPNGQELASGGWDGTVRIWDVLAEKEKFVLQQVRTWITTLAFSPDGRVLVTNENDPDVRRSFLYYWDIERQTMLRPPRELEYAVNGVAISPDSHLVAFACDDHMVRLSQLDMTADFERLPGHQKETWAIAFSSDGRTLASASDDHSIKLWDLATKNTVTTLDGHESLVSHIAYSLDDRWLASASYDGTVKLWDTSTRFEQTTLLGHSSAVRRVSFSPDGRLLASGGKDQAICLWEVGTGRLVRKLTGHGGQIRDLVFGHDGKVLYSASEDRTIRVWDVATGEQLRQLDEASEVWSLALSPDGRTLAAGNRDQMITLWHVASGEERLVLPGHTGGVRCLAFASDGRTLASGGADRTICIWQSSTGHPLLRLRDQPHEVNSIAFSPDAQQLAAAFHDGSIRVWSAPRHVE